MSRFVSNRIVKKREKTPARVVHRKLDVIRFAALSFGALASALFTNFACSTVQRETVDRFNTSHETNAWTSASDCEDALASRGQTSHPPRVGTWNVRFFPDSQESEGASEEGGTDIGWLGCAITYLEVDVLAVQEFKNTPRGLEAQQQLLDDLNRRTGGDWKIALATCQPDDVQHPGFLYDASRVTGSQFRELPVMNPKPTCSNDVSPGFGAYFQIAGGPDFHFVAVHMASGNIENAVQDRAYAISAMQQVTADAYALVPDQDILFAGDFNTSGCDDCDPKLSSDDEVSNVRDLIATLAPPLTLVTPDQPCSREDTGKFLLMDHFVVAQSMQELAPATKSHVSGFCGATECDRLKAWYVDARDRLSDHCPLTLDFGATDDDPGPISSQ